ncbi:thioesterase-like superfamily-domain-containing protein [Aspergillus unguis]
MSNPQSTIEKQIDVARAPEHGPDVFINTSSSWRPGARGIFGGFAIAQSLRAAQQTVRDEFVAHSLHGSFVFAGTSDDSILYHVERIRDGKGFCTRSVRAIQAQKLVFICTISFTRAGSSDTASKELQHFPPMPSNAPQPDDTYKDSNELQLPFVNSSVGIVDDSRQGRPEEKRIHQWVKACGPLSPSAGSQVQQAALAFMSDSYFLVGVPHSHEVWRFVDTPISEFYPSPNGPSASTGTHTSIRRPHLECPGVGPSRGEQTVAMMVSLDHTMYFHNVEHLQVDDWVLSEIQSSWAGNGRGIVQQRMWTKDGTLVATCIQEGIVRLQNAQEERQISHL